MADEIHYLQLNQLSERLRNKTISPLEATQHYLQRIEKLDPRLNAFNAST